MPREVSPLATAAAVWSVEDADLASAISRAPEDTYPRVFATSRMVALMEVAASRCLRPLLEEGELSVGVTVDVRHSAATPAGVDVTATARYVGMEGKLYRFEVEAHDPAGEIGRGFHHRAIVQVHRLTERAAKRRR